MQTVPYCVMDINGVKPVASRIKQRPIGAKTKTHISGQNASMSFRGASVLQAPSVPQATLVATPVQATPEHKAYPLPQYEAPVHSEKVVRKRLTRRKLVLRGAATFLIVVVTLAGLMVWNGYVKFHKVFHGKSVVAALATKPTATPAQLAGEGGGRVNILLAGISGTGTYGANLTDTLAVLSIDPVNEKATIVNLPSDLWVQQPTQVPYVNKQEQLNAVYEGSLDSANGVNTNPDATQAGLDSLDQVVEKVAGVNINYNLLINFQAFQQAIDTVGGVSVNVPTELYDSTLAWKDHVSPVIAKAGVQQMDGNQALLYVRSRQAPNGVTQVQRELEVLTALKDKVLSVSTWSNPSKLEDLMSTLGSNVYTDMSIEGAGQLYGIMGKIGDSNITSADLIGSSINLLTSQQEGNVTVAVPVAGLNNYGAIQQYIRGYMADGYVANEHAPITVLTGNAAGAAVAGSVLKSYGFNVTTTGVASQHVNQLTLVDLSNGADPFTLHALEGHYHVKAVNTLPAGNSVAPGSAKFVIIEP
jgi:LCP family protein required for cell wall assembly